MGGKDCWIECNLTDVMVDGPARDYRRAGPALLRLALRDAGSSFAQRLIHWGWTPSSQATSPCLSPCARTAPPRNAVAPVLQNHTPLRAGFPFVQTTKSDRCHFVSQFSRVPPSPLVEQVCSPKPPSEVWGTTGSLSAPVVMVQSIEDRNRDEPSAPRPSWLRPDPLRNLLSNPLVWPCAVEVFYIFLDYPMKLPVPDHEQVIEAFSPRALEESFADCVGLWSAVGCLQPALRPPGQGTSMELAFATRVKSSPYLLSRSRIRKRGVRP